ncbi:MAG: hypothetical protein WCV99_18080 [Sterolibacterium sp.]|jgi:hypothetical protein
MKSVAKPAAKKAVKHAAKKVVNKAAAKPARRASSALRGTTMSSDQLHQSMVDYGKEVSSSRAKAMAFLKSIGAPVKTASR